MNEVALAHVRFRVVPSGFLFTVPTSGIAEGLEGLFLDPKTKEITRILVGDDLVVEGQDGDVSHVHTSRLLVSIEFVFIGGFSQLPESPSWMDAILSNTGLGVIPDSTVIDIWNDGAPLLQRSSGVIHFPTIFTLEFDPETLDLKTLQYQGLPKLDQVQVMTTKANIILPGAGDGRIIV